MEQSKNKIAKLISTKGLLLVGVLVFILLTFAFIGAYYKNYRLREEIKSYLDEAAKLENDNATLRNTLKRVQSPDYVEMIGRTNFGLVKEGENQVVLVGSGDVDSRQTKNTVVESTKLSNPRQWWNYFFNRK